MTVLLRVAVPVPLPTLFDYLPLPGQALPAPGSRVLVPFGRRQLVAVVMDHHDGGDAEGGHRLRAIESVLDPRPLLGDELLASLRWAASYWHHPLGEVVAAALPARLRRPGELPALPRALQLTTHGRSQLEDPARRRGTRVYAVLQALAAAPRLPAELDQLVPQWRGSLAAMRAQGLVEECDASPLAASRQPEPGPALNEFQQQAVDAVQARPGFHVFLLDGVTGSGKTEVYMALIDAVLQRGQQALVLVPEIALTPQMLERFSRRLGHAVTSLHSGMGESERARGWLAAAQGQARIIIGTRSAAWVPLANPGIIVVDEEHDTSYKQHDGFRYHARDLAVMRARSLDIPIMLGSATPSLETLARVRSGRYQSLRLPQRAAAARAPDVQLIDVRAQRLAHGLGPAAMAAIKACLDRGEQALVFKNRRGYAPVLMCHDCGWSMQCADCERPMTLHRRGAPLRCHHCLGSAPMPRACPECESLQLSPLGQGTQRLEEALVAAFPDTRIVRVDRDSTRNRSARDTLLASLADAGPQVLVGTQMLAKGHDLPQLTLVVVVGVDEGLFSVDFRASERLAQLIVQVSGRAGRARLPGRVLLQTHHPDHPLLHTLLGRGYAALAGQLLDERREAQLPPWSHLALLRAEERDDARVQAFLRAAIAAAGEVPPGIQLHGPLPAPMPRRAGYQRGQILVEAPRRSTRHVFLQHWLAAIRALPEAGRIRWSIDVDPVDLY